MGKKNLNLALAVESAKAGYTPKIYWAKSVAKKKQIREKEPSASKEVLAQLRVEKIKSKLFHYQKQANKIAKKEKTLLVRKLTRKVKELTGEDPKTLEKKEKATSQLEDIKKTDHTKLGVEFLCRVLKSDETVWDRVKEHVSFKDLELSSTCLISVTASYKKEQANMLTDVKSFLAKLFNDQSADKKKDDVKEVTKDEKSEKDPYFIESLDQVDEEYSSVFDSEDDNDSNDDDDVDEPSLQPKKKNRLGQRARRELWEQKYGDKAKHVRKAKIERIKEKKISKREYQPVKPQAAPLKTQNDLHPSWVAKLEQKKRLQETSSSAPTRIVFE